MTFAAILSAIRPSSDSPAMLRGALHFAGQTLVEYQARQAARAGADRIMILVSVITPALSQAVDRLSGDGIAVALIRDMVSMVRDAPRDLDMLMVADGAVVAQAHFEAIAQIEGNVLLVSDDSRASAPFERIDAGQRWAGLARVTPALLFDTLDMIGEWDLALTLVRAAVQNGGHRITVSQDELLEGRVALVESQQQADLVAQAITSCNPPGGRSRGGIEHYLIGPLARLVSPPLMRMQVPALQLRMASMAVGAIALLPIELQWPGSGLCLLLLALMLGEVADRLDELALRQPPMGWMGFVAPLFVLAGIMLAGGTMGAFHLALLLAVTQIADRWGRAGQRPRWMVFTPGSALVLLGIANLFGRLAPGLDIATIAAIASLGAMILRRDA